jgi:hypothetical protein
MTKAEAKRAIAEWAAEEYDYVFDEVSYLEEPDDKIGIAYCEYRNEVDVDEQWYVDLDNKVIYCELNGEREPELDKRFDTYEVALMCLDFEWLIGEADNFIEEHLDKFEE